MVINIGEAMKSEVSVCHNLYYSFNESNLFLYLRARLCEENGVGNVARDGTTFNAKIEKHDCMATY